MLLRCRWWIWFDVDNDKLFYLSSLFLIAFQTKTACVHRRFISTNVSSYIQLLLVLVFFLLLIWTKQDDGEINFSCVLYLVGFCLFYPFSFHFPIQLNSLFLYIYNSFRDRFASHGHVELFLVILFSLFSSVFFLLFLFEKRTHSELATKKWYQKQNKKEEEERRKREKRTNAKVKLRNNIVH